MHRARRCAATGGLVAGLFFLLTLSACPKDPYEASTWIDKLDDPAEVQKAVDRLSELQDPKAIAPLAKVWRKHNRSSRVLRVIITLADQPKERGGPYWADAIPVLSEAVSEFQLGDSRSVEDAMAAADALGRAKDPSTVAVLLGAVNKTNGGRALPITDMSQNVRIAAMRALGNFGNDDRVVQALVVVLRTDPLGDENRSNPESRKAAASVRGAAADALGATRNPKAIEPLVLALFEVDGAFQLVRGALTRIGQPAVPELIKVFKGEHAEVNKLAKKYQFANDCSKDQGPGTSCVAPGALAFKSAIVLGDLRAREALPLLTAQLKMPARTSFFAGNGEPGPPDHNGVLEALRKIADPSASETVLAYLKDEKTDDFTRPIAIDVYSMLTRDTSALGHLASEMKNEAQDVDEIRKAASLAYARLARTKEQLEPLDNMIDHNARKAVEYDAKAKAARKEDDKADSEATANGFRDVSTLFWQHKVRALVGIACQDDVACYVQFLRHTPDQVVAELKVPDAAGLKKQAKEGYHVAAQERALLELAKLGPKASDALPVLLEMAGATQRLVREGVLLAMVQVARKPCAECITRLDEVVAGQQGQEAYEALNADTAVVRSYFAGAAAK